MPQLPADFIQKLQVILPTHDYDAILETFSNPKLKTFRVNSLKTTPESLKMRLTQDGFELTAIPWFKGAWSIPLHQHRALTEHSTFYSGELYIQNLSSMIAPLLLAPEPNEMVLDLAAAPGGKSLLLAAMMENQGWLSVVEPVKERFFRLKENLERSGVEIGHFYHTDGRTVGPKCPEMFDRVLLDAPCSSESRFSTLDPKSYHYWSPRKVKETSGLQKKLILSALHSLKVGGQMIYCTCAYSPEENEAIIQHALNKCGDAITVEAIELPFGNWQKGLHHWRNKTFDDAVTRSRRILPTSMMDGFFICKLKKHRSLHS